MNFEDISYCLPNPLCWDIEHVHSIASQTFTAACISSGLSQLNDKLGRPWMGTVNKDSLILLEFFRHFGLQAPTVQQVVCKAADGTYWIKIIWYFQNKLELCQQNLLLHLVKRFRFEWKQSIKLTLGTVTRKRTSPTYSNYCSSNLKKQRNDSGLGIFRVPEMRKPYNKSSTIESTVESALESSDEVSPLGFDASTALAA